MLIMDHDVSTLLSFLLHNVFSPRSPTADETTFHGNKNLCGHTHTKKERKTSLNSKRGRKSKTGGKYRLGDGLEISIAASLYFRICSFFFSH